MPPQAVISLIALTLIGLLVATQLPFSGSPPDDGGDAGTGGGEVSAVSAPPAGASADKIFTVFGTRGRRISFGSSAYNMETRLTQTGAAFEIFGDTVRVAVPAGHRIQDEALILSRNMAALAFLPEAGDGPAVLAAFIGFSSGFDRLDMSRRAALYERLAREIAETGRTRGGIGEMLRILDIQEIEHDASGVYFCGTTRDGVSFWFGLRVTGNFELMAVIEGDCSAPAAAIRDAASLVVSAFRGNL